MAVDEAVNVFRQTAHHTRSHSFASIILPGWSGVLAVMITILPVLSISIRAICTPAAMTALTALVTSCCRNVEGARAMVRKSAYRSLLRARRAPTVPRIRLSQSGLPARLDAGAQVHKLGWRRA